MNEVRGLFRGNVDQVRGLLIGLVPVWLIGVGFSHLLLWLAPCLRVEVSV